MKTKTYFFLFLISESINSLLAQTPKWEKFYGGTGAESAKYVIQTQDHQGYVAGGGPRIGNTSNNHIFLFKVDFNGDTLWTNYVGESSSSHDFIEKIIEIQDGNLVMCGSSQDSLQIISLKRNGNPSLFKTDYAGTILWVKHYGYNFGGYFLDMIETPDTGYIMVGFVNTFPDTMSNDDMYIVKTSSEGDTLWTKKWGGPFRDFISGISPTFDGGYLLLGGISDTIWWTALDLSLTKISPNGIIEWTKSFDFGSLADFGSNIIQTPDSGFVICGQRNNELTIGNAFLLKINSLGDTLFSKTIGPTSNYSSSNSISPTNDKGFIITGNYDPKITFENDVNIFLFKTDSLLQEQWIRVFGVARYDGSFDEVSHCVRETFDGGYIVSGFAENNLINSDDAYLIKTNCAGFAGPPLAKFNISPNEMKVKFENKSDSAVNFKCYFGDGDSLVYDWDKSWLWIRKSPPDTFTHVYADTGTYTITLLAGACGEWDTLRQTINIFRTAIAKNEMENSSSLIKITPNPMYDVIQVESNANEPIRLNMYDVTGKKLYEFEFGKSVTQNKNTFVHKINISFLPQGIYFYRVIDKAGNLGFGKIVKM